MKFKKLHLCGGSHWLFNLVVVTLAHIGVKVYTNLSFSSPRKIKFILCVLSIKRFIISDPIILLLGICQMINRRKMLYTPTCSLQHYLEELEHRNNSKIQQEENCMNYGQLLNGIAYIIINHMNKILFSL